MDLKFILGRKEGMTQIFTSEGELVPATVIVAGPCYVCQVKTPEKDGYSAVQVGFKEEKLRRTSKPLKGHFKKVGLAPDDSEAGKKKSGFMALKHLKEFRVGDSSAFKTGDRIAVDRFQDGDYVDVTGESKGRGTAGVIKRYGFQGGPKTHGGMCQRRPGSIGMHSDPGRVLKNKRMAGHYGCDRKTIRNLKVVGVIPEKNVLLLKGPVPGGRNGLIQIRTAVAPGKKGAQKEAAQKA